MIDFRVSERKPTLVIPLSDFTLLLGFPIREGCVQGTDRQESRGGQRQGNWQGLYKHLQKGESNGRCMGFEGAGDTVRQTV